MNYDSFVMQFELFTEMATDHPILYAEALFHMKPSTVYLISRGYHTIDTSSSTIAMSSSVLNGATLQDQKELDIDALPVTPEKPASQPKKKVLRRKEKQKVVLMIVCQEQKAIVWSSDDESKPEERDPQRLYEGEKEVDLDSLPAVVEESEDEVPVRKRSVRASQPDVHISDDDSSTDDAGEEDPTTFVSESQPLSQSQPIRYPQKKQIRSIVQLSSDEEEEVKEMREWNENDDDKLKECFERYKDMVDPWSMISYDSYFLENRFSKEVVMEHAVALGLKEHDNEDEAVPSKKRRIIVDDSDLCVCLKKQ